MFTIDGHEFVLKDQISSAAKLALWAKDLIGEATKASPETSIAWTGVCLTLPLLTEPTTAQQATKTELRTSPPRSATIYSDPAEMPAHQTLRERALRRIIT